MIVFDLECREGRHRFEGWFGSSHDFLRQQERGLVACPQCGSVDIIKAPMAPAVGRKGNQLAASPPPESSAPQPAQPPQSAQPMRAGALPPEAVKVMQAMAALQAEALKDSRWVGSDFAEESRAMHYGEQDAAPIHGHATLDEAKALIDEGIEVAPLPFPFVPPGKAN